MTDENHGDLYRLDVFQSKYNQKIESGWKLNPIDPPLKLTWKIFEILIGIGFINSDNILYLILFVNIFRNYTQYFYLNFLKIMN